MDKETGESIDLQILNDLEVLTYKYQDKTDVTTFLFCLLSNLFSFTYFCAPSPEEAKKLIEDAFEAGVKNYKMYHE